MRQILWAAILLVANGVVCPCAYADDDPLENVDAALFGKEVYRLPPVSSGSTFNVIPSATYSGGVSVPGALQVSAADNTFADFPAPKAASPQECQPAANVPMALPGVSLYDNLNATPTKTETKPIKLWEGNLNLGLDGTDGNSQTFNLHLAAQGKRKTEHTLITLNIDYLKQSSDSEVTAHRLFSDNRFEWLFDQSRWSCFLHNTVEYDEFDDFDVCDTGDIGFGYQFVKADATSLIGRLGGGYSHYYGGENNGKYFPEAVFGGYGEHRFNKRMKVLGTVEYAPDIGNFAQYRIRAQAAIEMLLSEEMNLSLKTGVLDTYNSRQADSKDNDFEYAVMVMWKF